MTAIILACSLLRSLHVIDLLACKVEWQKQNGMWRTTFYLVQMWLAFMSGLNCFVELALSCRSTSKASDLDIDDRSLGKSHIARLLSRSLQPHHPRRFVARNVYRTSSYRTSSLIALHCYTSVTVAWLCLAWHHDCCLVVCRNMSHTEGRIYTAKILDISMALIYEVRYSVCFE